LVAVGHHLVSFVVGCIVVVAMWDSLWKTLNGECWHLLSDTKLLQLLCSHVPSLLATQSLSFPEFCLAYTVPTGRISQTQHGMPLIRCASRCLSAV
jgi:hypothetical protein